MLCAGKNVLYTLNLYRDKNFIHFQSCKNNNLTEHCSSQSFCYQFPSLSLISYQFSFFTKFPITTNSRSYLINSRFLINSQHACYRKNTRNSRRIQRNRQLPSIKNTFTPKSKIKLEKGRISFGYVKNSNCLW